MTLLAVLDVALALGFALRLTRLVVTDDLGKWLLRDPAEKWAEGHPGREKLVSGLSCPWCVGFWLSGLVMLSLAVAGGPGADGTLAVVWRWVAAAFTLNWVVAHIGSRLGDAGYADDEDA